MYPQTVPHRAIPLVGDCIIPFCLRYLGDTLEPGTVRCWPAKDAARLGCRRVTLFRPQDDAIDGENAGLTDV